MKIILSPPRKQEIKIEIANFIEIFFELFLWNSRFFVVLVLLFSMIGGIGFHIR